MGYKITHDGVEHDTFVEMINGRIHATLRSNDTWSHFYQNNEMPIWEASGQAFQMLWPQSKKARDRKGYLQPARNTEVAYLPSQMITPGVYDDRICIDIILWGDALTRTGYGIYPGLYLHEEAILSWMTNGNAAIQPNKSEEGRERQGMTLLNTASFVQKNMNWT